MRNDREYRVMDLQLEERAEGQAPAYKVRGYASTFEPYVLFSEDGIDYSEQISPTAFDGADLSDVVFRIDHEGPVYARTSAGTVHLDIDDHGLANEIDLSRTAKSRELYEEIAAGNYPKMSFAFSVERDHYDSKEHRRIIDAVKKVYDVSAVSFPANPTTELSVSTRDWFHGVMEAERAERLAEEKRKRLQLRIRLGGYMHGNS